MASAISQLVYEKTRIFIYMFREPHVNLLIFNNAFHKLHRTSQAVFKEKYYFILFQIATYHKANYFLIHLFCFFYSLVIFLLLILFFEKIQGKLAGNLLVANVEENSDSPT